MERCILRGQKQSYNGVKVDFGQAVPQWADWDAFVQFGDNFTGYGLDDAFIDGFMYYKIRLSDGSIDPVIGRSAHTKAHPAHVPFRHLNTFPIVYTEWEEEKHEMII